MKKELKNIAEHLDRDIITEQEARTLLLGLLGVSNRRELLIGFANKFNKLLSDDQQFTDIKSIVDSIESNL